MPSANKVRCSTAITGERCSRVISMAVRREPSCSKRTCGSVLDTMTHKAWAPLVGLSTVRPAERPARAALSANRTHRGITAVFGCFRRYDGRATRGCGAGAVGVSIAPMIKHVVMWKLRGTSLEEKREQAARVRTALEGLQGIIPGMSSLEVGVRPAADEQLGDVVLISTHDDWAALKAYQVHPAHVEVARVISTVRIERRVLDFEVGAAETLPPDSMQPSR